MDREHPKSGAVVQVLDELLDITWPAYGARLEEIALADLQLRFARDAAVDLAALYAAELDVKGGDDDSDEGA
jgi:hypothetical protein